MKQFQPPHRLEVLQTVLECCSKVDKKSFGKNKIFTTGERIMINQERGSIFSQIAYQKGEITINETRNYQVSPSIEDKIIFTLNKINNQ